MSKQKYFADNVLLDRDHVLSKLSNSRDANKKPETSKRAEIFSQQNMYLYDKLRKGINLQPVQYNIEDASRSNVYLDSEEAHLRIKRLVEKQRNQALTLQSKLRDNSISNVPFDYQQASTKFSASGSGFMNKQDHTGLIEPSENYMKRKIVQCDKVPAYRGFNEAAPLNVTKAESASKSNKGSSRSSAPMKEAKGLKAPEALKKHAYKESNRKKNIYSQNESKRLISSHLPKSEAVVHQPNFSSQSQNKHDFHQFCSSPSDQQNTPTRQLKILCLKKSSTSSDQSNQEVNDSMPINQETTPPTLKSPDKDGTKEKLKCKYPTKTQIKRIVKTLPHEKEDMTTKKKNYNPKEIKKYISKKKAEKRKHELELKAVEKKKREETQQSLMMLIQHHKDAFQNVKKTLSKSKQDAQTQEKFLTSPWVEVFNAINPQVISSEEKANSNESNEMRFMVVSSTTSNMVTFSTSVTRVAQADIHTSVEMTTMSQSNGRLQKIQESARLLSSRLGLHTSELYSFIEPGDVSLKSQTDASIKSQTSQDIHGKSDVKSCDSLKDIANESDSTGQQSQTFYAVDTLNPQDGSVQKERDHFRVANDLENLKAALVTENKFVAEMENKIESLPKNMFPSENLRKKLSRKASIQSSEENPSLFNDARVAKGRVSFGADSTFDEFNLRLVHSILAKEENILQYQTSMSRIKQQAMDDLTKIASQDSPSLPRTICKRGMDDIYPQKIKEVKEIKAKAGTSRKKSHSESCIIMHDTSERQTEVLEFVQSSELVIRQPQDERNTSQGQIFKLEERYLAKKEETLRQRKEKLLKLLERLDSLEFKEREVKQMELEVTRRCKDLELISGCKFSPLGSDKTLKETAVQTHISPVPSDKGEFKECIEMFTTSGAKIDNKKQDNAPDGECSHEPACSEPKQKLKDLVEVVDKETPKYTGKFDLFSPARVKSHEGEDDTSFGCLKDPFRSNSSFDFGFAFSTETVEVNQQISKDSLELIAEETKADARINSHNDSELEDSLVIQGVDSTLKHASATEIQCSIEDKGEVSLTELERKELCEEIGDLTCTVVPDEISVHLENNSNHSEENTDVSDSISLLIFNDLSEKQQKSTGILKESDANIDHVGTLSSESNASQDSLAVPPQILNKIIEGNSDDIYPECDDSSIKFSCDRIDSGHHNGEPHHQHSAEMMADRFKSKKTDHFLKMTNELINFVGLVDVSVELPNGNTSRMFQTNFEDNSIPINTNKEMVPNTSLKDIDLIKRNEKLDNITTKLHNSIAVDIVKDILKDSIDAILVARKNKMITLRKDDSQSHLETKSKLEQTSDDWINDECFIGLNDELESNNALGKSSVNKVNANNERNDVIYIPESEEVISLVSEYLDIYWTQRRSGESWQNMAPPPQAAESILTQTPYTKYCIYLFELVGEILSILYKDENETTEEKPKTMCSAANLLLLDKKGPTKTAAPNTLENLKPTLLDVILDLLPPCNDFVVTRPSIADRLASTMSNREGKDECVESLLARELKLEEPDWINYEEDIEMEKNSLADSIFDSLLGDAVASVNRAFKNKSQHALQS